MGANEYNEFKELITKIKEDGGKLDVPSVNKAEKSEFKLLIEQIKAKETAKKAKQGKPISYSDTNVGGTLVNGIKNMPKEAIPFMRRNIEGLLQAVFHPINTATMVGNMAAGAIKKDAPAAGDIMGGMTGAIPTKAPKVQGDKQVEIWKYVEKELYNTLGTEENMKRFITENPWDAIQAVSEIVLPFSKALGLKKVANIANITEVSKMPFQAIASLPASVMKKLPPSLYKRALKFTDAVPNARKKELIKLGIDDKLYATNKAVDKMQEQIRMIEEWKNIAISESPQNVKMLTKSLFKGLDEYENIMLATSSEGIHLRKVIKDIRASIEAANKHLKRKDLDMFEVTEYKKRFNKELDKFYEQAKASSESMPFKKEVKSIINKNLRETLELVVPEMKLMRFPKITKKLFKKQFPGAKNISIQQLNEVQGKLIELKKIIDHEVNLIDSGDFMQIRAGYKAAQLAVVGHLIAGPPGATLGTGLGLIVGTIDGSSRIKMALGSAINTINKYAGATVTSTGTLVRLGITEAGYATKSYGAAQYEPNKDIKGLAKLD